MLTARDIMTTNVKSLPPTAEVAEAARIMLDTGINGLPVLKDNVVVGVICQSDLIAQQKKVAIPSFFTLLDGVFPLSAAGELDREMQKITALTVGAAMTENPTTVTPDTLIDELATLMAEQKLYTLPVVEEGRLVGVVGKEDILGAAFTE